MSTFRTPASGVWEPGTTVYAGQSVAFSDGQHLEADTEADLKAVMASFDLRGSVEEHDDAPPAPDWAPVPATPDGE